jgi:ABC-type multidrug transport system ATPase subunit
MDAGLAVDLDTRAEELKSALRAQTARASKALIAFAEEHAVTPDLGHEAIVLKQSFSRAEDDAHQGRVIEEMVDLVDRVVADHRARGDGEDARQRREARLRLASLYRAREPEREVVFSCSNLGKIYRKSGFELGGVDLTLRRGRITGVVGQNANGKTTLFRLVAGELEPDEGTLCFPTIGGDGGDIDWAAVRESMAYVPQELPKWYGSLVQNIQYEAALHGLRGYDNREQVDFIIERMGLEEHLAKPWKQLSGGFKLRFALARALVWRPKLLLLDEPLANLDFKAQLIVLKDLRDLANSLRYPMAVLVSSQHLHEIEAVSDDILFLRKGEVVYNGPTRELGEARQHNTFELGCPLTEKELRQVLADFPVEHLYYSGLSFVVTTPRSVPGNDLVRALDAKGVEIAYFRDISGSIKQLFD